MNYAEISKLTMTNIYIRLMKALYSQEYKNL